MKHYALVKMYSHAYPYWWEDHNDWWVNEAGGRCPKSDSDLVLERASVECYEDLDHTKTGLLIPNSKTGWLSPDGRFYGCEVMDHDTVARLILKSEVRQLELRGWIRVVASAGSRLWYERFPTAEQRNWASANLHLIDE